MYSIDQNCHSLWDVIPKLQALARQGYSVTHFVEDIDVAFTWLGATVDDTALQLAPERFHHSGGADWGAALFYSEFLGRLPLDVADLEAYTGVKTASAARQLGRSVEDLYDEFSPSDNWQLIGSSYIGDRDHHRIIGDLTVAEVRPFLGEILNRAEADMRRRFPARDSRQRVGEWISAERDRAAVLLDRHANDRLVDLYRSWLGAYVNDSAKLAVTSDLFGLEAAGRSGLLRTFLTNYGRASALYNEAVAEDDAKLRPLRRRDGELPFFAVLDHHGHQVRTVVSLRDGQLVIGGRSFDLSGGELPIQALRDAGVRCLAGKAVALMIECCTGDGESIVLPYRGSLYMPLVRRVATKLAAAGLLSGPFRPVTRVRLRLLDRMRGLDTPIVLPDHLAEAFGKTEITADELAKGHADVTAEARERLAALRTDQGRRAWQQRDLGELLGRIDALDARKRALARTNPKGEEIRALWKDVKALQAELLAATLRQAARDVQVAGMDYWDSRGAVLPWSIALGGEAFYNDLLDRAEIYTEPLVTENGVE